MSPDPHAPTRASSDGEVELDASERQALRERRPEALARFYEVYFDRVYGYVRRMVGDEHLAEDLSQDIFMHLHRSLPAYDPERALRPWVFTIATNKVRDFWRSRRFKDSRREGSLDGGEEGGVGDFLATEERGPDGRAQAGETSDTVQRAIQALPEGLRATLMLRYFEGLSFETIGEILDRKEPAVRKRYSRALEELRGILSADPGISEAGGSLA